jgi:RNA polymerase sigma factor for flagellar operon FliA
VSPVEQQSVDALWRRFKADSDGDARDRLVVHYSPLVKFVAGRVRSGLPASVDQNDLVSDGVLGLMDAIDKFEPERGLQFQTYAVTRIRGSIVDGLRTADWVPRSVREKIRDIDAAQARLEARLGRAPSDEEIADELELSVEELRKVYTLTAHTSVVSFETVLDDEAPRAHADLPGAEDDLPTGFLRAVRELAERDQVVVALYYWERLTLAEIGQVLGVTESRVSQLHSRATMSLRRKLLDASA